MPLRINYLFDFVINVFIILLSAELIALIVYLKNPTPENFGGFFFFGLFGFVYGLIFSTFNLVDNKSLKTNSPYKLAVWSGLIIFSGVSYPVFYFKRKKLPGTSCVKKIFLISLAINIVILCSLAFLNFVVYHPPMNDFVENIKVASLLSLLLTIPAILLGIYNNSRRLSFLS